MLKDINLNIEAGDFTLILGGAGAGKSTFIKAITGQQRSDAQVLTVKGKVMLDNMNLYKKSPHPQAQDRHRSAVC